MTSGIRFNIGITCLGLMLLAATALAQEAIKKAPIPDEKAQTEAMDLIREVYKEEYGQAITAEKRTELAKKLLKKAEDTKDDPTNKFVLLRVVRDMAAQAGDVNTALQAVDEMAAEFSIDALEMNVQVLTKAASVLKKNDDQEQIVEEALTIINQAIAQDKYEVADRLGRLALLAAHKAKDVALVKRAKTRVKEIGEAAKAFEEVETAMKTLEEKPLDPEANLVVGKHLCFKKGEWKQGRSMLALGGDATLKALALREMEGPAEAAEQVKLGDGWWNLAGKEAGTAQKNLQGRAGYWYNKALPGLLGLVKDKVEKRVAEVAKMEIATDKPSTKTKAAHAQRIDKIVIWNQHNGNWNGRGTEVCNVALLRAGKEVWRSNNLVVPWEVNKDTFLAVPIRRIAADTVRVEIVRWHQEGGGLSEVEVFSGKENIARGCRVMVSAEYDARFSGAKLTDGITTSSTGGVGYWLLPNGHSGWAEIHLGER